jgi:hypothetical protein
MTLLAMSTACSLGSESSKTTDVPVVRPSSAYGPFPYANAAQREAFQMFLICAADQGIDYDGPFQDSTGAGVFIRLAPGEHASRVEQQQVDRACPELDVAIFGTAVGNVHERPFEEAARAFVRCIRSHGFPDYPSPGFVGSDPITTFWQLPFDWSSRRFTEAVSTCIDPLHDYVFGG